MNAFKEIAYTLNYMRKQLLSILMGKETGAKGGEQERTSGDPDEQK